MRRNVPITFNFSSETRKLSNTFLNFDLTRNTYIENLKWVTSRVQNCEQYNGEQDQNEWLYVKEYQREEEIVTTVFEQQEGKEFLGELNSRETLMKSQSWCCRIWD